MPSHRIKTAPNRFEIYLPGTDDKAPVAVFVASLELRIKVLVVIVGHRNGFVVAIVVVVLQMPLPWIFCRYTTSCFFLDRTVFVDIDIITPAVFATVV